MTYDKQDVAKANPAHPTLCLYDALFLVTLESDYMFEAGNVVDNSGEVVPESREFWYL